MPVRSDKETIQVRFDKPPEFPEEPGPPAAFTWRGTEYKVAGLIRSWREDTERARGIAARGRVNPFGGRGVGTAGAGSGRIYYRVRTEDGGVFDLFFDPRPAQTGAGTTASEGAAAPPGVWGVHRRLLSSGGTA